MIKYLLLVLWLGVILALLHSTYRATRRPFTETERQVPWLGAAGAAICILPIMLFLISALFLLNAHPTVQFNAHSELARRFWSIWAHWWATMMLLSIVQIPVLFLSTLAASVYAPARRLRIPLIIAILAALLSSLILGLTSPRA